MYASFSSTLNKTQDFIEFLSLLVDFKCMFFFYIFLMFIGYNQASQFDIFGLSVRLFKGSVRGN